MTKQGALGTKTLTTPNTTNTKLLTSTKKHLGFEPSAGGDEMATYHKLTKQVKETLNEQYPQATFTEIDALLKGKSKSITSFDRAVLDARDAIELASQNEATNLAVEVDEAVNTTPLETMPVETTPTAPKSKKATKAVKIDKKTSAKTKKMSNFDLVTGGTCPHDGARLGDEIHGRGVGVTRTCETCEHCWYLNAAIRTCKCLTCGTLKRSTEKREVVKNEANFEEAPILSGLRSNQLS